MKQFQENQTRNGLVPFLNHSNSYPTDFQESRKYILTTLNGASSIFPLTLTAPHREEELVRYEQTNEFRLPLTSTVVLKRKNQTLYVPLDFENNFKKDALADSMKYVRAVAQNEFDRMKQQAPNNNFKINEPLSF